jgi:hypothetical protein
LLEESQEISAALKERLSSLRTKSQQTSSQYLAYPSSISKVYSSELSHQKTKLTTQTRTLTAGVRQFIQDHLAEILYAESKGALPGDPKSLPKSKRKRDEDEDEDEAEKELTTRMVTLVEVLPSKRLDWLEELMNRLARPDGMSQWVDVLEDDVVVRCLVRANIAIMNPNDGSKIRLVEFHKEVEGGEMDEDWERQILFLWQE